jgi:ribosomal-protein-alanine N-acetyltransferase
VTTTAPDAGIAPTIRPARAGDLGAVHRIERASFPQPWPYGSFESYLAEDGFFVAADGEQVVGYVVADAIPNHGTPLGHIKDIAVTERRRNEGVGSALLARGLDFLADAGAATAKLEVREGNADARRLYRRFGFEQRRRIREYYGNGEDALVMVCRLAEWRRRRGDEGDGDG